MQEEIINRVAQSPIVTIDLGHYYVEGERVLLDIKDQLFQGMILREKDFREFVKGHDWMQYQGKLVAVTCSAEAIVPVWAYMLLATKLAPIAKMVVFGTIENLEQALFQQALVNIDIAQFRDKPVVVKGCGDKPIPESAYVEISRLLQPVAKTIMYGEPCSTVPIYKQTKKV